MTCRGRRRIGKSTLVRERRFRLKDNYSRFYLKYIERNKKVIDADAFSFASLDELEGIDSVMGLAFENLVVNNYRELIPYLHMDGALVRTPVRVEFRYRRPWEKDVEPWKTLRLVVKTVGEKKITP